jgi:hypothetical protein
MATHHTQTKGTTCRILTDASSAPSGYSRSRTTSPGRDRSSKFTARRRVPASSAWSTTPAIIPCESFRRTGARTEASWSASVPTVSVIPTPMTWCTRNGTSRSALRASTAATAAVPLCASRPYRRAEGGVLETQPQRRPSRLAGGPQAFRVHPPCRGADRNRTGVIRGCNPQHRHSATAP